MYFVREVCSRSSAQLQSLHVCESSDARHRSCIGVRYISGFGEFSLLSIKIPLGASLLMLNQSQLSSQEEDGRQSQVAAARRRFSPFRMRPTKLCWDALRISVARGAVPRALQLGVLGLREAVGARRWPSSRRRRAVRGRALRAAVGGSRDPRGGVSTAPAPRSWSGQVLRHFHPAAVIC